MKKYLGCSGYYYDAWKGLFYPEGLPKKEWLEFYAKHFNTVEINNSFYQMPRESTIESWCRKTPKDFVFTLKGNRYITHVKKLKRDEKMEQRLEDFFVLADIAKAKLGCILWQLPRNIHKNLEKLQGFCELLDPKYKSVIEFRHSSWFDEEVYEIMRDYKVGFCILSAPENLPEDAVKTTDHVYLRMHGKYSWYNYEYSKKELKYWAEKLKKLKPKEVYVYFNNDMHAYAPKNCRELQDIMK